MPFEQLSLRDFIENMRTNALQRVQLADDLFARGGDEQHRREALRARGEVLAYETALQRLDAEAEVAGV